MQLNNPCKQNYNLMQPTGAGRFCGSCQKQVVDFTNISDEEVLLYFQQPQNTGTCGRFKAGQVDTGALFSTSTYRIKNYIRRVNRFQPLRYAALVLLPFLVLLSGCFMGKASKPIGEPEPSPTNTQPVKADSVQHK